MKENEFMPMSGFRTARTPKPSKAKQCSKGRTKKWLGNALRQRLTRQQPVAEQAPAWRLPTLSPRLLLKVLVALPVIGILFAILLIIRNDAPLSARPGLRRRLKRYLNQQRAETSNNSDCPELYTPVYLETPDALFEIVVKAVEKLGWKLRLQDNSNRRIEATITAPVLRLKDEISIQISPEAHDMSSLQIVSASRSRLGSADFGANIRHIMDLKTAISQVRLSQQSPQAG